MVVAGWVVRVVLVQKGSQILTVARSCGSLSPYHTSANFLHVSISLVKYVGMSNCLFTGTRDD